MAAVLGYAVKGDVLMLPLQAYVAQSNSGSLLLLKSSEVGEKTAC